MRTTGERFAEQQEVTSVVVSQRGNILDVHGVRCRTGIGKLLRADINLRWKGVCCLFSSCCQDNF